MQIMINPHRGHGLDDPALAEIPFPAQDAGPPRALMARCPRAGATPLVELPGLARQAGVAGLYVKDERARMGLGSFKALGAAYVVACDAAEGPVTGRSYVTASAGNHGLSLAAGAAAFGARAVIYLSATVPEGFAARLAAEGAEVRRAGTTYEDSMAAAAEAARTEGLELVSDSSWPGYVTRPHRLMEGYLVLAAEAVAQMPVPPSHVFLQAGVGGLAAAAAAHMRAAWGDAPVITVVEPEAAPALVASVRAGRAVTTKGPVSIMGRLDCKVPSLIALKGLARDADAFLTLTEAEAAEASERVARAGLPSTPSGVAGLAGLLAAGPAVPGLDAAARVLCILSEQADP
ncbi:pyridoxal-phosphate dependent enzyme [Pseudooceanicola sp. CBS1P-1]|uniref:Pyridoxal-phosphate dependent enzyme n=1 Tax=Pseudooceanicola albus TaxID=2692189 RepID=A0A6L7G263_9RHOB|nr:MULTISPECIES: pyridoxal-phosphate dependent enzyme [Pseudooceanicola]MBT9383676.1 pyridoxal-phosphate dependent enzyme [Pseudooceanicola endophyticus]MXN17530.1 pyridoxal-phosphate dependent enzyme [Pseudooceanicola albus]